MLLTELKNQLQLHYKYRIELHAHTTPASGCSEITPQEMVQTYKALAYDAVVITNHFEYQDCDAPKEEYVERYLADFQQTKQYGDEAGLQVYLGAEIRFTENHNDYLIFGVDEKMLLDIYDLLPYGAENFRKSYSMPDSLFIQAHPKRDGMQAVDPTLLDGIEVFNMHPGHNSRVGLSSVYAMENHIPIIIAGSDFHHPNRKHEGVSALRCSGLPGNSFELAKLLKQRDYLLEIGRSNLVIP